MHQSSNHSNHCSWTTCGQEQWKSPLHPRGHELSTDYHIYKQTLSCSPFLSPNDIWNIMEQLHLVGKFNSRNSQTQSVTLKFVDSFDRYHLSSSRTIYLATTRWQTRYTAETNCGLHRLNWLQLVKVHSRFTCASSGENAVSPQEIKRTSNSGQGPEHQ